MGGCAVLALEGGPVAGIPAGLAFLNVAIIGALFGWKMQWKPAFYILGTVDILVAIAAALIGRDMAIADQPAFWLAAGAFALKGILSIVYAQRMRILTP